MTAVFWIAGIAIAVFAYAQTIMQIRDARKHDDKPAGSFRNFIA